MNARLNSDAIHWDRKHRGGTILNVQYWISCLQNSCVEIFTTGWLIRPEYYRHCHFSLVLTSCHCDPATHNFPSPNTPSSFLPLSLCTCCSPDQGSSFFRWPNAWLHVIQMSAQIISSKEGCSLTIQPKLFPKSLVITLYSIFTLLITIRNYIFILFVYFFLVCHPHSRTVLSNNIASNHMWLCKFK